LGKAKIEVKNDPKNAQKQRKLNFIAQHMTGRKSLIGQPVDTQTRLAPTHLLPG
jgi:hypothetical protein